jgi:hypothetical protein
MDVKIVFLNGNIDEKLCKLLRSIYGLKQASRSWNLHFDQVIKSFGFVPNFYEACIYKKVSGSSVTFLVLYVDDILIIGNDIGMLNDVKNYLNKSFSMKDLGQAAYILGIKIYRDRQRRLIGLCQSTYLDKVVKRFRMDKAKKGSLPMLSGKILSEAQCPASAIGSVMYAMLCTRPDMSNALSLTSRCQSDPGVEHWTAVKNILKYLNRTKEMFLVYGGEEQLVVKGYVDASFDTDSDHSKSQTGYVYILNGGAVSWRSYKKSVIAGSTTEAEYMAASEASSEGVWIRNFIT